MAAPPVPSQSLTDAQLIGLYRQMWIMRHFEDALLVESKAGRLRGSLHLATGQEAIPAGSCLALAKEDAITMTYRGHGYALAKGCDLVAVVAEILGKESGLCKGKGGKMHLFDPSYGVLGANGIVAGGIPTALGAALAFQKRTKPNIAVTVFGDGALNQGVAMESLNLAALWKLPVIFLCENNLYAEMTPLARSSALPDLGARVRGFGIDTVRIDGNDPLAVFDAVTNAKSNCLDGNGPVFIEAMTYRTCGHYQLDPGLSYRSKEEVQEWEAKSPLLRFADLLKKKKKASPDDLLDVENGALDEVRRAFEAASSGNALPNEAAMTGVFV